MAFDTRRGRALTFGGFYNYSSTSFDFAEVHAFAFESLGLNSRLVPCTTPAPTSRSFAAMAYDSTADCLWMFGGRHELYNTSQPTAGGVITILDDLWRLELGPSPAIWQPVSPLGRTLRGARRSTRATAPNGHETPS